MPAREPAIPRQAKGQNMFELIMTAQLLLLTVPFAFREVRMAYTFDGIDDKGSER